MADDYYSVLEVPRSATQDEIQQAYRRLARKYHPDLQGDSKSAKKNFQRVQQAYDVLGDEEKRRQYDRFGPNFEQMRGNPFGGGQGGNPFGGGEIDFSQVFGGQPGGGGGAGPGGIEEMLRQWGLGGGPRGRGRQAGPVPPQGHQPPEVDLEQQITVPFATAVQGGQYQVTVDRESGKSETLAVRIPVGIESGKRIRLRGQGRQGPDGTQGDLLVVVNVAPHPVYRRTGDNLLVKLPVTIIEALEGTQVDLPTPHGTLSLKVPAGCSSSRVLRLKGMGIRAEGRPHGDLLAEVEIVVPAGLSADQVQRVADALRPVSQESPREELSW